jgi:LysR family glycine cleavage system transcriptional activator
MGRERLITAHLASGALVQALPGAVLEDPRIGWWFVTPRGMSSAPVQALHDWLAQTANGHDAARPPGTH